MKLITALHEIASYLTITQSMQRVRLTPVNGKCYLDARFGMTGRSVAGAVLQGAYDWQEHVDGDPLAVVALEQQSCFNEAIDGLDFPVGIPSPHLLAAVLKHPDYADAEATLVTNKRSGTCLMLRGRNEAVKAISLDTDRMLDLYFPKVSFKLNQNAIKFTPTESTIELLSHWKRVAEQHYKGTPTLAIFTRNKKAMGRFSGGAGDYVDFPMTGFALAKEVAGKLLAHFVFHTSTVLQLLKLHETADVCVQVYAEGAVRLTVKSEHARYVFALTGDRVHEASAYADLHSAMEINLAEQRMREFAVENP